MIGDSVRLFPLPGALLFPRAHLPLHLFEPRYVAMLEDALAGDRCIAMIQPRDRPADGRPPALYPVGCLGELAEVERIEDGRYNIVLRGLIRFRLIEELSAGTLWRQARAEPMPERDQPLASARRSAVEEEAKRFADHLGIAVNWAVVSDLDDEALVHAVAQVAPFDPAAKQALLEAPALNDRADLLVQLMQFARMAPREVRLQ